ncbi:response regulator [Paenibacillus sp. BR2-3]|uniref:response regulator transcription factor n=1 Tax=Paenibacillus sp. BR2-3 TaxID=3048494 RepID=UPI003977E325
MQLLILDDELHAIRGIEAELDQEKLGISVLHTALHVHQAEEIFRNFPIEIMICDIEMPEINGLQFMVWVKEHYPHTQCIILTCHSDFSYAKEAVHLGSIEYLLKPSTTEELENAIRKAVEPLLRAREQTQFHQTYQKAYELWNKHQPLLIERFWSDLISGNIPARPGDIRDAVKNLAIKDQLDKSFVPVFIRIDRWYKKWTEREEMILQYALLNAANECIAVYAGEGSTIPLNNGGFASILMLDPDDLNLEPLADACSTYISSCNQYFYCDLTCFIGPPVAIHELPNMLKKLNESSQNQVWSRNKVHLYYESGHEDIFTLSVPSMSPWQEMLQAGHRELLEANLEQFWNKVSKEGRLDKAYLECFYHDFLQMVYYTLQLKELQAHLIFAEPEISKFASAATRSVFHLQEWIHVVIKQSILHIHSAGETKNVVSKVQKYMSDHLDRNLTRKDVANYVFLNPDYLARIFKKETGFSILDYLMKERIEAARKLLIHTDLPVSTVGERVGIPHFSYFSKQFKRHMDMSPLDYRQHNRLHTLKNG